MPVAVMDNEAFERDDFEGDTTRESREAATRATRIPTPPRSRASCPSDSGYFVSKSTATQRSPYLVEGLPGSKRPQWGFVSPGNSNEPSIERPGKRPRLEQRLEPASGRAFRRLSSTQVRVLPFPQNIQTQATTEQGCIIPEVFATTGWSTAWSAGPVRCLTSIIRRF
jgi:hypothetical protein